MSAWPWSESDDVVGEELDAALVEEDERRRREERLAEMASVVFLPVPGELMRNG